MTAICGFHAKCLFISFIGEENAIVDLVGLDSGERRIPYLMFFVKMLFLNICVLSVDHIGATWTFLRYVDTCFDMILHKFSFCKCVNNLYVGMIVCSHPTDFQKLGCVPIPILYSMDMSCMT